jgi:hypothetical protein
MAGLPPSDEVHHFYEEQGHGRARSDGEVGKIKALTAQLGHPTLEIERSIESNKQQQWFIRLGKFSDPKKHFMVKDQWDWARDAEQHKTR